MLASIPASGCACSSTCPYLQFNLFGGSVLKLGTDRHHGDFLKQIDDVSSIGCFALTELGCAPHACACEPAPCQHATLVRPPRANQSPGLPNANSMKIRAEQPRARPLTTPKSAHIEIPPWGLTYPFYVPQCPHICTRKHGRLHHEAHAHRPMDPTQPMPHIETPLTLSLLHARHADSPALWCTPSHAPRSFAAEAHAPPCRYGNNAVEMETTATWDGAKGEFVINTPSTLAQKYWITNSAMHARWAVVFARLLVSGRDEGVHALLVRIRDDTMQPMPGVRIEDMGHKQGCNGCGPLPPQLPPPPACAAATPAACACWDPVISPSIAHPPRAHPRDALVAEPRNCPPARCVGAVLPRAVPAARRIGVPSPRRLLDAQAASVQLHQLLRWQTRARMHLQTWRTQRLHEHRSAATASRCPRLDHPSTWL